MLPTEAAELLGVTPTASDAERRAGFDRQRQVVENRIAQAPTPGLKEKYRQGLARLEEAYVVLEAASDGGDHPVLRSESMAASTQVALPAGGGAVPPLTGDDQPPAAPIAGHHTPTDPVAARSGAAGGTGSTSRGQLLIGLVLIIVTLGSIGGWRWYKQSALDAARDGVLSRISALPDHATDPESSSVAQAVTEYDRTAGGNRKAAVDDAWSQKRGQIRQVQVADLLEAINVLPADVPAEKFTELHEKLAELQSHGVDDARLVRALDERQEAAHQRQKDERQQQVATAKVLAEKQAAAADARAKREAEVSRRLATITAALEAAKEMRTRAESQSRDYESAENNRDTAQDLKGYLAERHRTWDSYVRWLAKDTTATAVTAAVAAARELKTNNPDEADKELTAVETQVTIWAEKRHQARTAHYVMPLAQWCFEQFSADHTLGLTRLIADESEDLPLIVSAAVASATQVLATTTDWDGPGVTQVSNALSVVQALTSPHDPQLTDLAHKIRQHVPWWPTWAARLGQDQYGRWADLVVAGITQRCRLIPAGTFTMGCSDAETEAAWNESKQKSAQAQRANFEAHQHAVTLTQSFWIADSACTQALWLAVMGSNPSHFPGDLQRPVETVSWDECQGFCTTLTTQIPGAKARIPTEAEWEYACRAGTTGPYNGSNLDALAWYGGNSGNTTHPVKQKAPNAWGLYDMHGNVWQWCADWYGDYPSKAVTNPTGPASGSIREFRGGGWFFGPEFCRSAYRFKCAPGSRDPGLGFRFCLPVQQGQQGQQP